MSAPNPPSNSWFYADTNREPAGPVSLERLIQMSFDGEITSNTYVIKKGSTQWKRFSELESAQRTGASKPIPPIAVRPPSTHANKPEIYKRCLWVVIPFAIIVLLGVVLSGHTNSKQARIDALEPERRQLAAEGQAITAAMEEANRNHDFSHVEEIRARNAEFLRRSAELLRKRQLIEADDGQRHDQAKEEDAETKHTQEQPAKEQAQPQEPPLAPKLEPDHVRAELQPTQSMAEVAPEAEPVRRLAPAGTVYNVKLISVRTQDGVSSILAGTELQNVRNNPDGTLHVRSGDLTADVLPSDVTNDLDVAAAVRANEANAQAALRQWQAQQSAAAAEMEAEKYATPTPAPDDFLQDSTPQPRYRNPLDRGPYR